MSSSIEREVLFPEPPETVWNAIASAAQLAEWMYPNDFELRVGHRFTFQVPPNPRVGFEGLTVHCEVLQCDPPLEHRAGRLVFSWTVGGPVVDTRVSFRLEPYGTGTRLYFEHAGFDVSQLGGKQAFQGAGFGWGKMLDQLAVVVARSSPE